MNEEQQKQAISGYMASVRFMDQQVGRLLDALDRLQIRENTIVVFISDHGYNLGEHDCWAKSSLWEGSVRIPMIISHPTARDQHGFTCSSIIQLLDLYPTLAELCGLSDLQPSILQGRSLSKFIAGGEIPESSGVAYTTTNGGKASSIRTDRWRYNRWSEEAIPDMEELYDHQNDPEEFLNLAENPEYQENLEEMRSLFNKIRNQARKN
jgi:arylsulfatase A-like enzyme